jgi:hypothetical protein
VLILLLPAGISSFPELEEIVGFIVWYLLLPVRFFPH